MEPDVLHTPRLVLSTPTADDSDAIHAACQDADIQRFTTVPSPYLREHAEGFISLVAEHWASGAEATWAIRHEDALVGMIGLARIPSGGPEIGYWVARRARGNGLLTEAARAVIDWGFSPERPAIERIEWRAVVGNIASARAARALGFRYEGMLRKALANSFGRTDAWIGGLLRDDDRAPQAWSVLGD
jgi:RimJ/RimL family protein N-acetyltransferase